MGADPFIYVVGLWSIIFGTFENTYYEASRFTLNNGREFDGTRDQAKLVFYLALSANDFDGTVRITIYDASGRTATKQWYNEPLDRFNLHELLLGENQGWTQQTDFDWRFLSIVEFTVFTSSDEWGQPKHGTYWIDWLHFSYYLFEPGKLTTLSNPSGKAFKLDSQMLSTPDYNRGITPNVNWIVTMEPTNFKEWEDASTNPERTINLQEAETKTITATYSTAPPNGTNGKPASTLPILVGVSAIATIAFIYFMTRK